MDLQRIVSSYLSKRFSEYINTLLKEFGHLHTNDEMIGLVFRFWFTEMFDDTKMLIRCRHLQKNRYYNVKKNMTK